MSRNAGGTANGERRTANGERRTANGERRTANGERRTANGERRTVESTVSRLPRKARGTESKGSRLTVDSTPRPALTLDRHYPSISDASTSNQSRPARCG
ncbi:hypothetical protein D7Y61_09370 [Stenotrophomonas maltophilia]|nr:hypothetical protein [Stenotrophomonas maltophilia]